MCVSMFLYREPGSVVFFFFLVSSVNSYESEETYLGEIFAVMTCSLRPDLNPGYQSWLHGTVCPLTSRLNAHSVGIHLHFLYFVWF